MLLIVGLGNPGSRYARNRHNVGFQVADLLAARHGLGFDRSQHQALVASGIIAGQRVLLAKPQTYMNESGRVVAPLARFYKIPPEALMVIFDDLDLPQGTTRLRPQGGAGGHNGMRSLIDHLGTDNFPRLRIGIGRPPGQMDPAAYVLQDFRPEEEREMAVVRQEAADAIELWLREGLPAAMNRYNT
ncbi:MAG: aminoacyl-tRNA hydrolase [Ardenticatenaceae bacterium]|nr:aminoacyl-tRNA hydrolase [Ardenticatenaceae bacterium]HBY95655.1 aminoacyl-tRNA hydrolase [Chloroflexota bacterium]